jgi:NAD(P)-dependent dehydrogenase (short-subunit alcohol dehydrogenase family)
MANPFDAYRLDDRVAVVTGAASGIGAATCEVLAAAGATVRGFVNVAPAGINEPEAPLTKKQRSEAAAASRRLHGDIPVEGRFDSLRQNAC